VARGDSGLDSSGDFTALNRSTYDRIASRYVRNQTLNRSGNEGAFSVLERSFLATVPAGGLVADLGCGPGVDGARFAGDGFRVVGLDLSTGMLSMAATHLDGLVMQADLRALPLVSGRLDGIWSVAALLHVPEDDTDQVLRECRRAVRDTGVLALVTAVGDSTRFEDVPYAPGERRWFVYRRPQRLGEQLRLAGWDVRVQGQLARNRLWLTILADAV
jgi:SAM-dependent methyltransferase